MSMSLDMLRTVLYIYYPPSNRSYLGTDENSEVRTLYDRKNQTNSYDFLRIKQVHALLLSVSLKPNFVVIASL